MRRVWVGLAAVSALGVIVWLLIQAWRGPFITAPESPVTDSERFEKVQSEVSRFIRSTVGRGVTEWDRALIAGALTEDFKARFPAVGEGNASQEPGFQVLSLSCSGRSAIGIDAFLDRLENHVSAAGKITRCDFDSYEFLLDPSGESAAAAYHRNVGGRPPDGRAVELQADLKVEVVRIGDDWRIRRLAVEKATWIESDLTPFVDVSGETGFSFPYTPQARQVIQEVIDNNRGSTIVGGLSVVYWDEDGFPDGLLATLVDDPADRAVMTAEAWGTTTYPRCSQSQEPCLSTADCDIGACSSSGRGCSVSADDCRGLCALGQTECSSDAECGIPGDACSESQTCLTFETCQAGKIYVMSADIVPTDIDKATDTLFPISYTVQADCGSLSEPVLVVMRLWADADDNGLINIDDAFFTLKGFQSDFPPAVPSKTVVAFDIDGQGCTPNQIVNINDVLIVILAFQGERFNPDYLNTFADCSAPCP